MIIYFIIFLFGLIIGSFLNVVILRYNTGRLLGKRSACFSCAKPLRWYELVPLFSFVLQRGRCRGCESRISWQYPIVEALVALLFLLTAWQYYPNYLAVFFVWIILALLLVIAVYDLKHKIIPDAVVYVFIILSFLAAFYPQLTGGLAGFFGAHVLAGLVLFVFFWAMWFLSRGMWMGFGDAKLALGIGFLLGPLGAANAVIVAFWIGAVVGLVLVALGRTRRITWLSKRLRYLTIKSEIPFAPFLVAGVILVLLFSLNVIPF
jgi:prepilin signal peptidase PulO-like enzyme (type II secretory pathway)